ncbi:MAG: HlyC/CorC family transporter [Rhizobiaceae bacterium]|nr:HlyC/CorC family transporter [Rhizobiaceae bacterium]
MSDIRDTPERSEAGGQNAVSDQAEEGRSPAVGPIAAGPTLFERLIGLFKQKNGSSLRDDLADALSETATDAEAFSPGERAMLNNILRLREVRVEDVMVPRADIQAVDVNTSLGELLQLFEESGHSRMPVYSETLDDPRGMVHIRDVLAHITRQARAKKPRAARKGSAVAPAATQPPASASASVLDLALVDLAKTIGELGLMRTVLFVPPSMLASDLMNRMQAARTQMALVIDEYGGTDGLASLEDIVEMVVGDIEDEHDDDEPMITQTGDGVFVVDGKADIDEVAAKIGDDFKPGEHGDSVDTIGGMIFNTLGRVPARGEVVQAIPGFEFHVLDADPRRVKRVRIVHNQKARRRPAPRTDQPG